MKCPKCRTECPEQILGNVHHITHTWDCPIHGTIKSEVRIDGEVIRSWRIEDE